MFAVHVFGHISKHAGVAVTGSILGQSSEGGSGGLGSVHLSFQCSAEDRVTFRCIDILLLSLKTSDLYNLLHTVRKPRFRTPETF